MTLLLIIGSESFLSNSADKVPTKDLYEEVKRARCENLQNLKPERQK